MASPRAKSTPLASSPRTPLARVTPGRPKPVFLPEPQSFSTKKERGSSSFKLPPPKPHAKTCPPVSRVFKRRPEMTHAQSVTFVHAGDENSVQGTPLMPSAVYDSAKKASYFEQAFSIEAKIGSGCFGDVYRVKSKVDGKLYAVKIARERYRGQGDRAHKLEEVRKHQLLPPHSNCVHFYQSWEEKGRLYQQFELCEESLMELAESQHDIPESTIWAYLVDLLLAVEHLHDHDLIHMDIKPENIFIGREGICKLGDFGLVIDLAKDDTSRATEGDPKYLATEILESRKFTKAADIFSLGVTILELACDLDLPKQGRLWHRLRTEGPDPSLTARVSPELHRVIQLMMTNYHERRPTVKKLLSLPAVRRARAARQRDLFFREIARTARFWAGPVTSILWFLVHVILFLPSFFLRRFRKETESRTPQAEEKRGPIFCLGDESNSLEEDFIAEVNKSRSSLISSPLALKFSDDSDDEEEAADKANSDILSATPKLSSGASRTKSRSLQKKSPNFVSPKKRLNFDDFETSSASPSLKTRSGGTKSSKAALNFDSLEEAPLTSRLEPKSRSSKRSRTKVHFTRPFQEDGSEGESIPEVRPLSLASRFDCFSEDDDEIK